MGHASVDFAWRVFPRVPGRRQDRMDLRIQGCADQSDNDRSEDRAFEAVVLGQTRPDATSGELIDAAVTRGEISSEQALLYGVYLACGDPRLPAAVPGTM